MGESAKEGTMISLRITSADTPFSARILTGEESINLTLLRDALQVAVPLWCAEVEPWDEAYRAERRAACSLVIASQGDNILFKGKKPGQSADAFNRLAEGIALLALAPGGVKLFGLHFEATET